jgi:hypothetical protein
MEPLSANGFDPALLRVVEKRGHEHEQAPRRKRKTAAERSASDEDTMVDAEVANNDDNNDGNHDSSYEADQQDADGTGNAEGPKHTLDDLA